MDKTPKNGGDVRAVKSDDGVELHYEVLGNGPAVVVLHGALVGRAAFSRMRGALAESFTLILPSSRGHDGSELTLPPDYGFETSEVRDLTAILDAEGLHQVHLMGHSSGGATAFAFARDYPERVDRLVLVEPSLFNLLPPPVLAGWVAHARRIFDAGAASGDMAALRVGMDILGGDAWHALDEPTKANRLARLAPLAPLIVPHHHILLDFAVSPADLAALKPATMLFYGGKSFDFEPHITAAWRQHRPDLTLTVIEPAGHNVHHDCPDIVGPAVIEFLTDAPGQS
jgi:pimeloyl-ACP methyl ester carboxylesterase